MSFDRRAAKKSTTWAASATSFTWHPPPPSPCAASRSPVRAFQPCPGVWRPVITESAEGAAAACPLLEKGAVAPLAPDRSLLMGKTLAGPDDHHQLLLESSHRCQAAGLGLQPAAGVDQGGRLQVTSVVHCFRLSPAPVGSSRQPSELITPAQALSCGGCWTRWG